MPLVRVRTYLGKKLLGEPTRPYASEVTVKAVIDRAIEPLEGIELVGTVDVFKDAGEKNRTAQLPLDCLNGVTVGELVSNDYGTNLITHVKSTAPVILLDFWPSRTFDKLGLGGRSRRGRSGPTGIFGLAGKGGVHSRHRRSGDSAS